MMEKEYHTVLYLQWELQTHTFLEDDLWDHSEHLCVIILMKSSSRR